MKRAICLLMLAAFAVVAFAETTPNKTVRRYFNAARSTSRNGYIWINGDSADVITAYPAQEDTTGKGKLCTWVGGSRLLWYFEPDSTDVYKFYETTGADTLIAGMDFEMIWYPAVPESSVTARSIVNASIDSTKIASGSIPMSRIKASNAGSTGQYLQKNGGVFTWASPTGSLASFQSDADSTYILDPDGTVVWTARDSHYDSYIHHWRSAKFLGDLLTYEKTTLGSSSSDSLSVLATPRLRISPVIGTATSSGSIKLSDGSSNVGTISPLSLSSDETWYLPEYDAATDTLATRGFARVVPVDSSMVVDGKLSPLDVKAGTLGAGKLLIGSGTSGAQWQTANGDATVSSSGAVAIAADVVDSSNVAAASLSITDLKCGTPAAGKYLRATGSGGATFVGFAGQSTHNPGTGRRRSAHYVAGLTTSYRAVISTAYTTDNYEPSTTSTLTAPGAYCKTDSLIIISTQVAQNAPFNYWCFLP